MEMRQSARKTDTMAVANWLPIQRGRLERPGLHGAEQHRQLGSGLTGQEPDRLDLPGRRNDNFHLRTVLGPDPGGKVVRQAQAPQDRRNDFRVSRGACWKALKGRKT